MSNYLSSGKCYGHPYDAQPCGCMNYRAGFLQQSTGLCCPEYLFQSPLCITGESDSCTTFRELGR